MMAVKEVMYCRKQGSCLQKQEKRGESVTERNVPHTPSLVVEGCFPERAPRVCNAVYLAKERQ
jgi:hypothetical protein